MALIPTTPEAHHEGHLLGIVEVTCSMRNMAAPQSVKIAEACKEAIESTATLRRGNALLQEVTGEVEVVSESVQITVDPVSLNVFNMDQLVSQQEISRISALVAVPSSNRVLTVTGKCQKRNMRVAVVLDMYSAQNANALIDDYYRARETTTLESTAPEGGGNTRPQPTSSPKLTDLSSPPRKRTDREQVPRDDSRIVAQSLPYNKPSNDDNIPPVLPPRKGTHTKQMPGDDTSNVSQNLPQNKPSNDYANIPLVNTHAPCLLNGASNSPMTCDLKIQEYSANGDSGSTASEDTVIAKTEHGSSSSTPTCLSTSEVPSVPPRKTTGSTETLSQNGRSKDYDYIIPLVDPLSPHQFNGFLHTSAPCNPQSQEPPNSCVELQSDDALPLSKTTEKTQMPNNEANQVAPNPPNTSWSEEDDYIIPLVNPRTLHLFNGYLNTSIDSDDDWSDSSNEPEYVSEDTCYLSLGMSIEDSERLFIKKPITKALSTKSNPSLEKVIDDFLEEDKTYMDKLLNLNKAYKDLPGPLQNLLRRIPSFCKLHEDLHVELQKCGYSCSDIAKTLLKYRERLHPYVYYNMRAHSVNDILATLPLKMQGTHIGIKDAVRRSWRQLNFYIQSLEKLVRSAAQDEKPLLNEAIEMFRDLSRQADTELLLTKIKGAPYLLQVQGFLLLHGSFVVSGPHLRKGFSIRAFLFENILVLTEQRHNKYEFLLDLPIKQSFFVKAKADNVRSFALEFNYGGILGKKTYTFRALDRGTKQAWVSMIKALMKIFAEQERLLHQHRDALY